MVGVVAGFVAECRQWAKNRLADWQRWKYGKLLEELSVTYDGWIRETERKKFGGEGGRKTEGLPLTVRLVPYEACRDYLTGAAPGAETADVVLFAADGGQTAAFAEEAVAEYFRKNAGIIMAYGDEDVMGPDGIRYTPWLKPHWSPDTFLSFFYFGSIFAVRTAALRGLTQPELQWIWRRQDGYGNENENKNKNGTSAIYRLCYVLAVKSGGFSMRDTGMDSGSGDFCFPVGHVDEVLFHARSNRELELLRSQPLDRSGCPLPEAGCHGGLEGQAETAEKRLSAGRGEKPDDSRGMLSVVIPSKDNEQVLKRCIESVTKQYGRCAERLDCEVIVVDNGSREEVRRSLEDRFSGQGEQSGWGIRYRYLYREMPFHFSRMCNLGAEAAAGDVLLFLNDDVDLGEDGLLERLYDRAKRVYTGAVGAKLYYPDSRRIQHGGIVNLRLGPVHKLQFKEDTADYFYGWNRRERNVIAVTGACLAVERKKFWEAGGFPEELPVAFNDVDLCFSLFEKGYYQVVLQNTDASHYESMSRGSDDDREKLERLLGEKDKLYARHPGIYGTDPFYHKYLAGDMLSTGFELRSDYDWNPKRAQGRAEENDGLLQNAREDACVMVSLEYAGTAGDFLLPVRTEGKDGGGKGMEASGSGEVYLLQGYSFVAGSDNACYEKRLLLERDKRLYSVAAQPVVRRDVEENLPDQINVGMTGFCQLLGSGDLPAGSYRVGVMAKDRCSGQKLYTWTNRYLEIAPVCCPQESTKKKKQRK